MRKKYKKSRIKRAFMRHLRNATNEAFELRTSKQDFYKGKGSQQWRKGEKKMKESINTKVAVFCSDCVHKNVCKWEYKVKEAEDQVEKVNIDELCTTNCRPHLTFNCPEKINAKEHFL